MEACKSILTPVEGRLKLIKDGSSDLVDTTNFKRLLRSLRYLTTIGPDIIYGVSIVNKFMESP